MPRTYSPNSGMVSLLFDIPRYGRMFLVALFAFSMALAVFPIASWILIFLANTSTNPDRYAEYILGLNPIYRQFLFWSSFTIGLVGYLIGWLLYVGNINTKPIPNRQTLGYFVVSLTALMLVAFWFVSGVLNLTS